MKMYRDESDKNPNDSFDEYSTRDEPRKESFQQKIGYDERDGPPEEEEEKRGYVDDPDEVLDELNYRRR